MPAVCLADVCASVKMELLQEATFERNAFIGRMRITNGLDIPLEELRIDLAIRDSFGNDAYSSFYVSLQDLEEVNAIDGTADVPAGASAEIRWLFIPTAGAGGEDEAGMVYSVGASVGYVINDRYEIKEVVPDSILVLPQPLLSLDYFLPGQVYGDDPFTPETEEPVPFALGVRVQNTGAGEAASLKIDTGSPRIVDNDQGLLIDFAILGSEVNGSEATESFLVDFGSLEPAGCATANWLLQCSLSGRFIEFATSFTHSEEFGGEFTSLMENVIPHFLVSKVLVDLPGRDLIPDFLATIDDAPAGPLAVYESECGEMEVTDYSSQASLLLNGQTALLSTPAESGALYAKLADPYGGEFPIDLVKRSDGKLIKEANVWLSKEYDLDSHSWNHFINLFDISSPGLYQFTFSGSPIFDSDSDGLSDDEETALGTNAFSPDTDGDGINDGDELNNGTDPRLFDTDGDGYGDGYEIMCGSDPDDMNDTPVIHVDITNDSGLEDGSFDFPYNSISEGIAAAPANFTVLVHPGHYEESLKLEKAFILKGDSPSTTTIDGGTRDRVVFMSGAAIDRKSSIQYFRITGGLTNGIICANGASPTIANNLITATASQGGAAIAIDDTSAPHLFNNTISENPAATAIECLSQETRIVNNIISGNLKGIDGEFAPSMPFIDFNNLWANSEGDYLGLSAGPHDLAVLPRFIEPENGDFHLSPHSPCLDGGDPVKYLTSDYEIGVSLQVDGTDCLFAGDAVTIRGGGELERSRVVDLASGAIELDYPLLNSYILSETFVSSSTSDFSLELEPNGGRINQGAFGNTPEATPALASCQGDNDLDGDVDGADLAAYGPDVTASEVAGAAAHFGKTDCLDMDECLGDFDNDGDTDGEDLCTLILNPFLLDPMSFSGFFGKSECR
ncbi:DUF1565 domain-containing protein [archaeon]|nr:DUF1565 domain-containing protein [archaeon]